MNPIAKLVFVSVIFSSAIVDLLKYINVLYEIRHNLDFLHFNSIAGYIKHHNIWFDKNV